MAGYFASFERPKACSPPVSLMDLDMDIIDITKLTPFKSIHLIQTQRGSTVSDSLSALCMVVPKKGLVI